MNIDNLHNALGLLDDELIEEVEVIRNKGKVQAQKRSKKGIIRYASLAASILVCAVSVYVVGGFFLNVLIGGKKSDSSAIVGEDSAIKGESSIIESDQDTMPPQDSTTESENASAATGETKSEAREIKVEVTELTQDGFVGIIKESADTEMYTVGTELTVVHTWKILTEDIRDISLQHKDNEMDDVAFPVGSVVVVRFMNQDVVDTGSEEIMLYADSVTFEENE